MFSRICSKRTLGFSANRSIQHAIFIPRRQYAKMVDDKNNTQYFLAADPKEAERLKLNQEVIRDYMKGKLVEANLDLNKPGLRILDSATASGVWLQDLRSSLGEGKGNTYIGTDHTNIYFPQSPVPGIHFQNQSRKDPWPANWNGTFDLFHQRMALPAAGKECQVLGNGKQSCSRRVQDPFTAEELDHVAPHLERELLEHGGTFRLYCVYGQRPEKVG